jgi:hypothetical protein
MTPAYGRDYNSRAAALADWESGKDFYIHDLKLGGYCSKRDARSLKEVGFTHITFRNSRGTILVNIPIGD